MDFSEEKYFSNLFCPALLFFHQKTDPSLFINKIKNYTSEQLTRISYGAPTLGHHATSLTQSECPSKRATSSKFSHIFIVLSQLPVANLGKGAYLVSYSSAWNEKDIDNITK